MYIKSERKHSGSKCNVDLEYIVLRLGKIREDPVRYTILSTKYILRYFVSR